MPVGRKSLYTEDLCQKAREYASKGLLDVELAKALGISIRTFYTFREKYPHFSQAIEEGRKVPTAKIERSLYKRALGYEAEDVEAYIDKDNRLIKARKMKRHMPGDVSAMKFWLKNKSKDWSEKKQLELERSLSMNVQPLSSEDLDLLWDEFSADDSSES